MPPRITARAAPSAAAGSEARITDTRRCVWNASNTRSYAVMARDSTRAPREASTLRARCGMMRRDAPLISHRRLVHVPLAPSAPVGVARRHAARARRTRLDRAAGAVAAGARAPARARAALEEPRARGALRGRRTVAVGARAADRAAPRAGGAGWLRARVRVLGPRGGPGPRCAGAARPARQGAPAGRGIPRRAPAPPAGRQHELRQPGRAARARGPARAVARSRRARVPRAWRPR